MPFHKIQNINISQNILHRLINVVKLSIDSAGDTSSEVEITAISREKALALKNVLSNGMTENVLEEQDKHKDTVKVSLFTLFLVGVTQNHLKSLSILLAALMGLLSELEDVFKFFGAEDKFNEYTSFEKLSITSFFIMLLFTAIIAVLYSFFTVLIKNFGLKAVFKGKKLDVFKGLFNKVHYALNIDKIQSFHIETNIIKDRFNLYNVKVQQAMSNQKSKKNIELVGVRNTEIEKIIDLIYTDKVQVNSEKIKPNGYFLFRDILFTILFVIVLNIPLFLLVRFDLSIINIILIPVLVFLNILSYKKRWFSITDTHIISGRGSVSTLTDIIEIHKIQAVNISQSFGQKQRSLANINIFVASTKIALPCVEYNKAIQLHNYLLYSVENTNKKWN